MSLDREQVLTEQDLADLGKDGRRWPGERVASNARVGLDLHDREPVVVCRRRARPP